MTTFLDGTITLAARHHFNGRMLTVEMKHYMQMHCLLALQLVSLCLLAVSVY